MCGASVRLQRYVYTPQEMLACISYYMRITVCTRRVSFSIFDEERSGLHNATRGSAFEIITTKYPTKYSQGILQEDPDRTQIMAHIYFMDHVMSTLWTVFFGVTWWSFTAHDGKRITNSPAQEEVATGGASYGHHPPILSETQRAEAALELWNEERNSAAFIILAGWCIKVGHLLPTSPSPQDFSLHSQTGRPKPSNNKSSNGPQVYFIIVIYTYALHLRHGTYRTLPLSRSVRSLSAVGHFPDSESEDEDSHLHDVDDFHQPYPPRANGHGHRYSASNERLGAGEVVFDAEAGSSSNMNTPKTSR